MIDAESSVKLIQQFLLFCYGKTLTFINEFRFRRFYSSVSGNLRELPPCERNLKLHILRSSFESRRGWGNLLNGRQCLALTDWGWLIQVDETLQIKWFEDNVNVGVSLDQLIKTCMYKQSVKSCENCFCLKSKFSCLIFCDCRQACTTSTSTLIGSDSKCDTESLFRYSLNSGQNS